jgi:hypothetical protein
MPKTKRGFVKLVYSLGRPPAVKDIPSDELCYLKKHSHGVQPTKTQIASLMPSLYANVQSECVKKRITFPGDEAVLAGRQVETFTRD